MNKQTAIEAAHPLALLRADFPAHQVSKLPKEMKAQREERERDRTKGVKCQVCGGWHHRNAVHLDYVGHAALTDRLLDTDMEWSWEPVAFTDAGLPAFDSTGGLWIKLTVCGVTRLGYGHAAAKPQMDPGSREKEVIGDALRNAAMRFGAALDLWHKGDLHVDDNEAKADDTPRPVSGNEVITNDQFAMLIQLIEASDTDAQAFCKYFDVKAVAAVPADRFGEAVAKLNKKISAAKPAKQLTSAGDIIDDDIPY